MEIVCISNTHNLYDTVVVPDGDVLGHAGDYSMQGHVTETQAFLTWFASQPHRHKVFVAGNHDFIFEKREQQARAMVPPGIIYLGNEGITLEGSAVLGQSRHAVLSPLGLQSPSK